MKYQYKLKTCTVRPFRSEDAESIAHHANNRKIWINLRDAFPHPYHVNDAIAFINMKEDIILASDKWMADFSPSGDSL